MELHIVLHEPEIPQNTGSIGRTCMAVGAKLHLIQPLGFQIDDKHLRRAGLDYWKDLEVEIHSDWPSFRKTYPDAAMWYFTTKARLGHDTVSFEHQTFLVFGKETAGLPVSILNAHPEHCLRIPIQPRARSLNLAVAVGVAAFEVLRQDGYAGLFPSNTK